MSVIKFKNRQRLFPWYSHHDRDFVNLDDFFINDFYKEGNLMPALNVKENTQYFDIELSAPGFTKDDINIHIEDHVLLISGESKKTKEEQKEDENYIRKEFNFSSFKRSLQLPETADTDKKVIARYQDGILRLQIPKKDLIVTDQTKRTIEVI